MIPAPGQIFLDPRNPRADRLWLPADPIPKEVRRFGYFPDVEALLPGDLVLTSSVQTSLVGSQIRRVQEDGGYAADHARWEHAAVYIGHRGEVCEATRNGVHLGHISAYIGKHVLRFRRAADLPSDTRWHIVVNAMARLGTKYGFGEILDLYWQSRIGYWKRHDKGGHYRRAIICSELYSDAFSRSTGRVLWNTLGTEVTPAFLSASNQLTDVSIAWKRIRSR
jgi:hypothetical protein